MLEAAVDHLGRSVRRAGAVKEREDVRGTLLQGATESADLDQRGGEPCGEGVEHGVLHLLGLGLVGFPVGGDDALVGAPDRFDLDMLLGGEHRVQPDLLLLGEQARADVEGAAGLVERGPRRPSRSCWTRCRQASSASPARRKTWNGSITGTASGSSSAATVLNPVNPSIATTSIRLAQSFGRAASHCLNTAFGLLSTMSGSLAGPVSFLASVRSMITVTFLSPNRV